MLGSLSKQVPVCTFSQSDILLCSADVTSATGLAPPQARLCSSSELQVHLVLALFLSLPSHYGDPSMPVSQACYGILQEYEFVIPTHRFCLKMWELLAARALV